MNYTKPFEPAEPEKEVAPASESKLAGGWVNGLVENQKRMLFLIEKKPNISKEDLSKAIGISETTISKHFKSLKKNGVLCRIGSNKKGHWRIEPPNDEHVKTEEILVKNGGVSDGVSNRVSDGLVENQKRMLLLIEKNPHISKRDLSEAIGISETTVSKHLKTLKTKGLLQRIGTNKNGHWQILSVKE
jgi:predicted HTH transcriptional regulator